MQSVLFAAKKKDEIARAEKEVNALDERKAELESLIAQNASDFEKLSEYCAELEEVKKKSEEAMERWLLLCDE